MKLYYHKTDGGAEYLTDKFIKWKHNGKSVKEGVFEGANFIVRIDGDITKDAELTIRSDLYVAAKDLLNACIAALSQLTEDRPEYLENDTMQLEAAIAKAIRAFSIKWLKFLERW